MFYRKSKDHISWIVIALFIPMALAYWQFKVDDAYISFVYAKNLILGQGLTYNGIVVEGYSNFIWTVLIAPFIWFGFDPLFVARAISLISACVGLAVAEEIVSILNPEISIKTKFLSLLMVAITAPFASWTMGGLEAVFMCLWVTLFVYWEIRQHENLSVFACLICALIRPEGVMLFFVMLAHRMLFKKEKLKIIRQSFIFIFPFGIYLLWRYMYYGYLLPNTAFSKLDPSLQTSEKALTWLLAFFQLRPLFSILVIIALVILVWKKQIFDQKWSLVIWVVGAYVFFILYSGSDWMPNHRFLVPVLLLFCPLLGKTLSFVKQKLLKPLIFSIALGALILEVYMAMVVYIPYSPELGNYTDGLIRGGMWIRENTQPDDVIAVFDAGALAYYSERRVIDILGLNDEHIAHTPYKSDPDYVLAYHPKIMQLHIGTSPNGEVIAPSREDRNNNIYYREDFQKFYSPYLEKITDPYFPLFFIRQQD